MCVFVVAMHCDVLQKTNPDIHYWVEKGLFQLAVPFFFVTSGFLLGSKMNNITDIKIIKSVFVKYIKRCFKLLIVFEPIAIFLTYRYIIMIQKTFGIVCFLQLEILCFIQRELCGIFSRALSGHG